MFPLRFPLRLPPRVPTSFGRFMVGEAKQRKKTSLAPAWIVAKAKLTNIYFPLCKQPKQMTGSFLHLLPKFSQLLYANTRL